MSKKLPLAAFAALSFAFGSNAALAADWTVFQDPSREISVIMPTPVRAKKTKSGGDEFEADDGTCTYSLSVRRRAGQPIDTELPAISTTYCALFIKVEADKGNHINLTFAGNVAGKNWKGRVFSYTSPSGIAGSFLVASSEKHNYILHSIGSLANSEGTKRFYNSFEVH